MRPTLGAGGDSWGGPESADDLGAEKPSYPRPSVQPADADRQEVVMKPAPQFNRLMLLLIGAALVLSRGVTSSSSSPKAEAGAGESPAQVAQAEPLPP